MNKLAISQTIVCLGILAAPLGWAQPVEPATNSPALNSPATNSPATDPALERVELEEPKPILLNRIGVGYRMGLNITVDFKKLGGFPAISDPGPALGIADRTYDNGSYNRVDSSTNAGGLTWFWGYENPGQLQGNALVMESVTSPNDVTSKNRQNDPQHGFEISYQREFHRDEKWRMGAEAAFGYTTIDVSDSKMLRGNVNRLIDTYTIPEGVIIPAAPYHGTFLGPGALISALPERNTQVISREATITGDRDFYADVYVLRLGPYFEVPIYKRLSAFLSGGLTLAIGDSEFDYRETVTIEDSGSVTRSSSGSQTDFLVGWYVAGNLAYAINDEWGLFAGVQFQAAGRSVNESSVRNGQIESKKQSVLDLNECLMIVFGVSYSF